MATERAARVANIHLKLALSIRNLWVNYRKLSPKIMTSISVSPALSVSYIWQLIVNYITVPVLLFQGALLHPYFEPDPQARKIRAWLAPVIIFLVTYSQKTRLFRPLEDYIHINCWSCFSHFDARNSMHHRSFYLWLHPPLIEHRLRGGYPDVPHRLSRHSVCDSPRTRQTD